MTSIVLEEGTACGGCPDPITSEAQQPVAFNCEDPACVDLHAYHGDCLPPGLLAVLDQQREEEKHG